jgi:internalin A
MNYNTYAVKAIEEAHRKNLYSLTLFGLGAINIPPQIGQLRHLIKLDLSLNGITELPSNFGLLSSLRSLTLRANNLPSLPSEIYQLKNLEILDAGANQITEISPLIGQLANLEQLDLSNNLIRKLPKEILTLSKLKFINLQYNPIEIPPEITRSNSAEAILNYYFAVTEIPRQSLNEIKLLLVGQGSVGKTSIIHRILDNTYDPKENKTEGIEIRKYKFKVGDYTYTINVWDFGGQEIMHATHQFFLTKRSLYLLVLDSRLTQEENRVEYWLKIIQSFGGESPILIVGNKTDQHPLDIDRTGLQKKYPNIVGILETSAATGAGIEALKAEIAKQVNVLPHVRDLLPETWFTVKSKLEQLGKDKNFITQDEYLNLCDMNDVTDETSQHTLIGFLHDLGVVLHFQDDPRLEALGILNPQWVTNGVYKILNWKPLFENKGVLTLAMLNDILKSPDYPSDKRLFIVDMMKKFELCYDIEPDKIFLIPDLLPKDQPEGIELKSVPAFEYQYPVLPSSVITRFIVRMNQHIENNVAWRTGVVLKIGDNKAIVIADIEDKKISIYIDGLEHTRRDALSAIRYQLDEIHTSIKGLNPQKRIPIPEAPNAEPLDYDYLLQLEREGIDQLPVKDGNRLVKVNVRKLLSAVESEAKRKETASNITNVYVAGDVKGSNIVIGNENNITITKNIFKPIYRAIEKSKREETEKADLVADVNDIESEISKGEQADESFLARRLRNLKKSAPDIADVALSALAGPGAAISTIVKKVAGRIKAESK